MSNHLDRRSYAPAAERNREAICAVLETVLPSTGTILEIASGTGQHAVYCAPRLSPRHWLPSDPNPAARQSIQSWLNAEPTATLHPPLNLDVTDTHWVQLVRNWQTGAGANAPALTAIANINMIHIAPWSACEGLIAGAKALLPHQGILYFYGPFMRDGKHTAPSNEAFDRSLRSQNPAWGVRDLRAVEAIAAQHHFQLSQIKEMPANNLSLIFQSHC